MAIEFNHGDGKTHFITVSPCFMKDEKGNTVLLSVAVSAEQLKEIEEMKKNAKKKKKLKGFELVTGKLPKDVPILNWDNFKPII